MNDFTIKQKQALFPLPRSYKQKMMLMGLKRWTKYTNFPNVVELRNTIADKVIAENNYPF